VKPADFNSIREDLLQEVSDLAALPYRSVGTKWMLNRKREQLKAWDAHVAEDAETEKVLRDLYVNLLTEAETKLDEKLAAANVAHLPVPRTPQTASDMCEALQQSIERVSAEKTAETHYKTQLLRVLECLYVRYAIRTKPEEPWEGVDCLGSQRDDWPTFSRG
jgi:hypothetical protein